MKHYCLALLAFLSFSLLSTAQRITYSETDRDDPRTINFEILGKIGGNTLIYKSYRDLHFISVYDNDMKLVKKQKLDYLQDRISSAEFLVYSDQAYMIYQYQKRAVSYCMAIKLNSNGEKVGDPILLDTTSGLSFSTSKVYSLLVSEDKQRVMVFKINTRNDKLHLLTTLLYDKDLNLMKRSRIAVQMPQRNDFLTEFSLDNEGTLACIRASGTSQNDNINQVTLIIKKAAADGVASIVDLPIKGIYLDDIRIKADNLNRHYIITSYYSKQRRGNIEGLYYFLWDKDGARALLNTTTSFSDEFRTDAKSDGNLKTAFNDFFLKNIILRKDGGFIVVSESAYSSSRGNTLNRWDYLYGSPYWGTPLDYYQWNSPLGYYPWWRGSAPGNSLTRYYADNITVISFDPEGKMEWSNVIRKSQYDDNNDNYIGYGMVNTGDKLNFLFNIMERRDNVLTDQSIAPNGQINRNPTFKNLDRGYTFMPRHAKQVGSRQVIIPCDYRGFTCFAKIDY